MFPTLDRSVLGTVSFQQYHLTLARFASHSVITKLSNKLLIHFYSLFNVILIIYAIIEKRAVVFS